MSKPTMYVELDGPIIIPADHDADPFLNGSLAPYAKPFMHWANEHFNVQLLTENNMERAQHAIRELGLKSIPVRGYLNAKTDLMSPHEPFLWVDSILTPTELAWLAEHGLHNRVITTSPEIGITEEHKKDLEQRFKEKVHVNPGKPAGHP